MTFEDDSTPRAKAASAQIEAIKILSITPGKILNPMENAEDYAEVTRKAKEELNKEYGSNSVINIDYREIDD